jgi:hypothetical protein
VSIQIQFSTSPAFSSAVIRRLTHSPFSHVDLIVKDGLLGVSGKDDTINDPGGVRIRPFNAWPYLTKPKVAMLNCTDEVTEQVIAAARSQIGKPFDNDALYAMLNDLAVQKPRDWRDPSQWFCSEFVIWSLEAGKIFPYTLAATANRLTPNDVLLVSNPFMTEANIKEFLEV